MREFGFTIFQSFTKSHELSIIRPRLVHFVRRNRELDSESIEVKSGVSEGQKLFQQLKHAQLKMAETFMQHAKSQVELYEQYTQQMDTYKKQFDDLFESERSKKRK